MGPTKAISPTTAGIVDQLFGATADAMVVTSRDGRVVNINLPAERLFGYSRDQLKGQKSRFPASQAL